MPGGTVLKVFTLLSSFSKLSRLADRQDSVRKWSCGPKMSLQSCSARHQLQPKRRSRGKREEEEWVSSRVEDRAERCSRSQKLPFYTGEIVPVTLVFGCNPGCGINQAKMNETKFSFEAMTITLFIVWSVRILYSIKLIVPTGLKWLEMVDCRIDDGWSSVSEVNSSEISCSITHLILTLRLMKKVRTSGKYTTIVTNSRKSCCRMGVGFGTNWRMSASRTYTGNSYLPKHK